MTDDDGFAISYKVLPRGTVVRSSDGVEVGTVRNVQDNVRENIFDGIVVDTRDGPRFVDAPEVARVAERAVTLTITAAEVAALPTATQMKQPTEQAPTTSRVKRWWDDMFHR